MWLPDVKHLAQRGRDQKHIPLKRGFASCDSTASERAAGSQRRRGSTQIKGIWCYHRVLAANKRRTTHPKTLTSLRRLFSPHRRCDRHPVLALWWSRQPTAPNAARIGQCRGMQSTTPSAARIDSGHNKQNIATYYEIQTRVNIVSTSRCLKHQSWMVGLVRAEPRFLSDAAGTGSHQRNKGRGGCAVSMIDRLSRLRGC
jgi:hypothetical protein